MTINRVAVDGDLAEQGRPSVSFKGKVFSLAKFREAREAQLAERERTTVGALGGPVASASQAPDTLGENAALNTVRRTLRAASFVLSAADQVLGTAWQIATKPLASQPGERVLDDFAQRIKQNQREALAFLRGKGFKVASVSPVERTALDEETGRMFFHAFDATDDRLKPFFRDVENVIEVSGKPGSFLIKTDGVQTVVVPMAALASSAKFAEWKDGFPSPAIQEQHETRTRNLAELEHAANAQYGFEPR
jgi:hypothetical protein